MSDDRKNLEEYSRFFKFLKEVVFPNQPPNFVVRSEFHNELVYSSILPMSVRAAPRGFLKSTTLARYRILHRLVDPSSRPELRDSPPDVLIVSETTRLSKEHLEWIKGELLGNPYLIKRYGNLTNPQELTWNEDEIKLTNGARCIALGYNSQIRGRHPTDIVVDDLEGLQNMGTEESLSKLKDWFYRVLMGAMTPETHLNIIGTIIARESLLSELVTHEEFNSRVYRALEESVGSDGKRIYRSLWPDRYPVEMLLKLRRRLGTHRFNAEYQNEPLGLAEQIIRPEWVRHHTDGELDQVCVVRRYMAVDPAFTEERWGDYSAIIILDEAENGRLYERLAWRKKVALPELRDTIMSFYRHYSRDVPVQLTIEEVAAQKVIRQSIHELDSTIPITVSRPDKDKPRRLIGVSRYFEMGIVSVMSASLEDEILSFPLGDKDRVDALVYALRLYETNHPQLLGPSQVSELNPVKAMPDLELDLYMERASARVPGYTMSSEMRQRYEDATNIVAYIEEMMI